MVTLVWVSPRNHLRHVFAVYKRGKTRLKVAQDENANLIGASSPTLRETQSGDAKLISRDCVAQTSVRASCSMLKRVISLSSSCKRKLRSIAFTALCSMC
jgi:hypothetical protein